MAKIKTMGHRTPSQKGAPVLQAPGYQHAGGGKWNGAEKGYVTWARPLFPFVKVFPFFIENFIEIVVDSLHFYLCISIT